jgi:hypothetical protein
MLCLFDCRFEGDTGHVAARVGQTLHQPDVDRGANRMKYRGDGWCDLLCSNPANRTADHEHIDVGQQRGNRLLNNIRPRHHNPRDDEDVLTVLVSKGCQAFLQSDAKTADHLRRSHKHAANSPAFSRRFLCPREKRPHGHAAAKPG